MARRNKNLVFHKEGWNEVVKHVIDTDGVDRMKRVADAANAELHQHPDHGPEDGFKVSTEGDDPLNRRDYSATVITETAAAMAHNARHNTLIKNLPLAGGE